MSHSSPESAARLRLALSMLLFGTIGIFRRGIALPSTVIALVRAAVGTVFLLALLLLRRQRLSLSGIRRNLLPLLLSGAVLGFNWILLFEAYQYTTVATATLCYYMAPIFVLLASPLLLGERLTRRRAVCAAVALGGMALVSGAAEGGLPTGGEGKGIALGLAAAALYAAVVLLNKRLRDIPAYDRTIVQLGVATLVLLPYAPQGAGILAADGQTLMLLLVMGIVHTGLAYALYFGTAAILPAQTLALFSYIDPIVAVLLSALLLRETMGAAQWLGAAAVLGATLVSELSPRAGRERRS